MTDSTIALAADSMEPRLLDRWIREGHLPNLARLRKEGAGATVHCTPPPTRTNISSAVQWSTHFTGVGVETHGIDAFTRTRKSRDGSPDAQELFNLSDIPCLTYPELLDHRGRSVGLLNPLPIWPPLDFEDGYCVSGMLTPPDSDRWVSPEEIASELTALNYKIDVAYPNRPYGFIDDDLFGEVSIEQLYEDMFEVMDVRIAAVKHLIETREVDYFYCLLKSVDIIQHAFWAHMEADDPVYGEAILDSYKKVDQLIGWLRTERPDSNIVLFSDHGGQARPTHTNNAITRLLEGIASPIPTIPGPIKRLYQSAKRDKEPWDGEVGNPGRKTGIHRNEAVLIANGPDVTPCSERLDVAFEDITPTLLALLGEPIPEAYIGEPIRTLINTDYQYTTVDLSVNRSVDITIQEQERISERLHNLGYADMVDK